MQSTQVSQTYIAYLNFNLTCSRMYSSRSIHGVKLDSRDVCKWRRSRAASALYFPISILHDVWLYRLKSTRLGPRPFPSPVCPLGWRRTRRGRNSWAWHPQPRPSSTISSQSVLPRVRRTRSRWRRMLLATSVWRRLTWRRDGWRSSPHNPDPFPNSFFSSPTSSSWTPNRRHKYLIFYNSCSHTTSYWFLSYFYLYYCADLSFLWTNWSLTKLLQSQ